MARQSRMAVRLWPNLGKDCWKRRQGHNKIVRTVQRHFRGRNGGPPLRQAAHEASCQRDARICQDGRLDVRLRQGRSGARVFSCRRRNLFLRPLQRHSHFSNMRQEIRKAAAGRCERAGKHCARISQEAALGMQLRPLERDPGQIRPARINRHLRPLQRAVGRAAFRQKVRAAAHAGPAGCESQLEQEGLVDVRLRPRSLFKSVCRDAREHQILRPMLSVVQAKVGRGQRPGAGDEDPDRA